MSESKGVKIVGAVLAPFVAAWDALARVTFGFFGFLEKLDPTGPIVRLVQWLGERLAPLVHRIKELLQRVAQSLASLVRHPLELLDRLLQPVWALVARLAKRVMIWLRTAQESPRHAVVRLSPSLPRPAAW